MMFFLLGKLTMLLTQVERHEVTADGASRRSHASVLIVVGSLNDSGSSELTIDECIAQPNHDVAQEGLTVPSGAGRGCMLRDAILLANAQANHTLVTVLVRSGRISLASPLPTLTGRAVQVIGSAPRRYQRAATAPSNEPDALIDPGTPTEDDDDDDAYYPHGETSGQSGPIGTVLDGGGKVQLIRTAVGSSVHLQTLRLENGAALAASSDEEPGSTAGGAIHSRGTLVLTNVAVRNCRAVHGGGLYTDGPETEAHHSIFTRSSAERCGGCAYVALSGRAHFERTTLSFCHDSCGRHFGREAAGAGRYALPAAAAAAAAALPGTPGASGGALVGNGAAGRAVAAAHGNAPEGLIDSSGAVAQGPPLVGNDVAERIGALPLRVPHPHS